MKILQIIPTLSAGGAETFVTDLAISQTAMGHDVDVFLLAGIRGLRGNELHSRLKEASVRCLGTDTKSPRDLRNAVQLFQNIVASRYDVIHAHLFSAEVLLTSLLPTLFLFGNRPLLVRTLHNSDIYGTRPRVFTHLLSRIFHWNFACGQKVLENYVAIFGADRSSVIENGVSISLQRGDEGGLSFRQTIGLPLDSFVVTCIGAFRGLSLESCQKAQDVAIRAFHSAFGNNPSNHLLLVGDGELRQEAESLVRQLGADVTIHFLKNLSNVHSVLSASDLLIMPSRYEGLPIVGLEAGCAGVPVLASSIPELEELGTRHGWIFPEENSSDGFARCLAALSKDRKDVRRRAIEMSAKFRERYGIERCANGYLAHLTSQIESRRAF